MKSLCFTLWLTILFVTISCSQKLNQSGDKVNTTNESELLSFSCKKSFEHFIDLDSILNEIPDTLGFKLTATGDSVDWRLNKARGIQWDEWGEYYKNPTITSIKKEDESSFITVEFTGGGGYDFGGDLDSNSETLYLRYSIISDKSAERSKDTRYILVYEIESEVIEGKEISVEYKD